MGSKNAQNRLKKLQKKMDMRIPLSPVRPSPPPPQPALLVVQGYADEPPQPPPAPLQPAFNEETLLRVERIKALARQQPGASPLAIMGALS